MAFSRDLCVLLLCTIFIVQTITAKREKKRGKAGKLESVSEETDLEKMAKQIDALEEKVAQLTDGESGTGNNVHFFFHGEDDHSHGDDNDHHVHIDLHLGDHCEHDDHAHHGEEGHEYHSHSAHCQMEHGHVHMTQGDHEAHASFMFDFDHLGDANTEHAVHVHQFGDMSNGCTSLGGHYDPYDDDVDVGDLGTLMTDADGAVNMQTKDSHLTLIGPYSIVGRSIIIHNADGSHRECCVIGWALDNHEHDPTHDHDHHHDHFDHASHDHGDHASHDHSDDHSHHHHH